MTGTDNSGTLAEHAYRKCPYCAEPILAEAKKCKHCGEFVARAMLWRKLSARAIALLGLATAGLSLFYALREGYYYIEQQQQSRTEIASYLRAADQFIAMDTPFYAEQALTQALALAPSDAKLQRRLFLLKANGLLDRLSGRLANTDQMAEVGEQIMQGYRLLQADLSTSLRVALLVALARLLPEDRSWNDAKAVDDLYEQAMQLAPEQADVQFHYGQWLFESERDQKRGLAMIERAVELNPRSAVYLYRLGHLHLQMEQYRVAHQALHRAWNLMPELTTLQEIHAANSAKSSLRTLLIAADKASDISQGEYLGMDVAQRKDFLEQVLATRGANDRQVNQIAARFYVQNGFVEQALAVSKLLLTERDLSQPVRGYNAELFELYAQALQMQNPQAPELPGLRQKLAEYYERQTYLESMEWGIEGRHRYKVGLRVGKDTSPNGVRVLTAYSGYPFAKAGLQAQDIIQKLAHRVVTDLASIHLVLDRFAPGDEIPVEVLREQQILELVVRIE